MQRSICSNSRTRLLSAEDFDIDGALLAGPTGDARWNNLGYWRDASDYTGACRALARLHGQAARLQPGQHVLELACGQGASFAVWSEEFTVGRISALEYRASCVSALNQGPHPLAGDVVLGRFDVALPETLAAQTFDAVLCVDAAYHARTLQDFACTAASALAPGGMLVFSTLAKPAEDPRAPARRRGLVSALKRGARDLLVGVLRKSARIPPGSILAAGDLRAALQRSGLTQIEIQDLSASVFDGFARWVEHRHRRLPWRQRWSPGWLKIRLTGRWCASIDRRRLLRYVLVSAQRE